MSLSREQIEILENQYLVGLYDQMEREVIADIARRVKKTGRFTETAEIMARDMREQGYNTAEIQKAVYKHLNANADYQREVAENTKAYKLEIKQIIEDTEAEALAQGNMLVAQAGDMAWNDDMQMWSAHDVDLKKDNELKQLVGAVQRATGNAIKNITGTTGTLEAGGVSLTNAYRNQLDLALIKMATGSFSFNQAYQAAIERLAHDGIKVAYRTKDDDGRIRVKRYHLDTAVRMCLRTGMAKLSGSIMQMNMQKTKTDLVYVDAHAGARPEHAVWQGKVYVYNGLHADQYPQYGNFFTETDYGSVTGLQGVNCMHNWYPYWPGDPIPEFKEPDPVMIDGKEYTYYECTQEQRRQERDIRQLKRDIDGANAVGDKELSGRLTKQLGLAYDKYTQFSLSANLRPKYERISMADYSMTAVKNNVLQLVSKNNRYFNHSDKLYDNVLKIKPIPNYTDIAIHGDPYGVCIKDANGKAVLVMGGEAFGDWIDKYADYNGGNIRLFACESGAGEGIVPKTLAKRYNVNVMAPDEVVNVDSEGVFWLANGKYEADHGINTGRWYLFKPDGSKHLCDMNGNLLENTEK